MQDTRQGFTLLELLAVMAIVWLLSGLVTLSVQGHLFRARLVQSIERVATLDRKARDEARRDGVPVSVQVDRERGEISLVNGSKERVRDATRMVTFPRGVTVSEVRVAGQSRRATTSWVVISSLGQSSTYAVKLSAPNRAVRWLVTLGLTGQQLELDSESQVNALLSL